MLTDLSRDDMLITVESPGLTNGDNRAAIVAQEVEKEWGQAPLIYEVGESEGRSELINRASNRSAWLIANSAEGKIPMLSTDETDPLTLYGNNHDVEYSDGKKIQLATVCQFSAHEVKIKCAPKILGAIGISLNAYWGIANKFSTASKLGSQIIPVGVNRLPPNGLPALRVMDELAGPFVPQRLGWINYWSPEVVNLLGFPDNFTDACWMRFAEKLENGAWLVRLTDEPLDLNRKEHFEVLVQAYSRFCAIGRTTACVGSAIK